ncbi:MAG: hypothetical protein WCE94_06595, partial [Candidatus Methanoperedens sp.]
LTILPLMDWFRDELNAWLVPKFDADLYLNYDHTDIESIVEEWASNYDTARNGVQGGFLTVNEGRDKVDTERLPGAVGDVLLWPSTIEPQHITDNPSLEEAQTPPPKEPQPKEPQQQPQQLPNQQQTQQEVQ